MYALVKLYNGRAEVIKSFGSEKIAEWWQTTYNMAAIAGNASCGFSVRATGTCKQCGAVGQMHCDLCAECFDRKIEAEEHQYNLAQAVDEVETMKELRLWNL